MGNQHRIANEVEPARSDVGRRGGALLTSRCDARQADHKKRAEIGISGLKRGKESCRRCDPFEMRVSAEFNHAIGRHLAPGLQVNKRRNLVR